MIDHGAFFDGFRRDLGPVPAAHDAVAHAVENLEYQLSYFERSPILAPSLASGDVRRPAYQLATQVVETTTPFVVGTKKVWITTYGPIHEFGGTAYFHRMYDIEGERPSVAKRLNNLFPGDGALFHGRGRIQLTGRGRPEAGGYAHAAKRLTELYPEEPVDLVGNPDLACDQLVSMRIMDHGMDEGWFTGQKFSDFLHPGSTDYRNCRRIINGTDRADEIAGYAARFEKILKSSLRT